MSESQALVTANDAPLTVAQVRAQINLIQEVMRTTMQDGQHFGKVPGCGDKPTLLKPGAEKILATFRIAVDPQCEDLSFTDCIRYRVTARAISCTGTFLGAGVGECSSDEEKYKWRSAVCHAEFEATPEDRRRIKYLRNNGTINQIRTNPADIANTVLKMAKKRALVDMTLTVTAASDIFTQDIEDLPAEILNQNGQSDQPRPQASRPPIAPPQRKSEAAPSAPAGNGNLISEAQAKRMFAISKGCGWENEDVRKLINGFGFEHTRDITRDKYEAIINSLQEVPVNDELEAVNE